MPCGCLSFATPVLALSSGSRCGIDQVLRAAAALDAGEVLLARSLLRPLLLHAPDQTAASRVARLFAAGLAARVVGDRSAVGNLYQTEAKRDMLGAFRALTEATPFVRFGHHAANRAILRAVAGAPRIHLIDVGIGSGAQWLSLLEDLARRPNEPAHVHLTGIDLPEAASRLREAGAALCRHAAVLGLSFTYEPVAALAEKVQFDRLRRPGEVLAVNAAFALHHIPGADVAGTPNASRDAVLGRLRDLCPCILTLVEPDVEHNALPFLPRLAESLSHYLTVFDALEARLVTRPTERGTLEEVFFGSEIRNVITGEGPARVERHERFLSWERRLRRMGFVPTEMARLSREEERSLGLTAPFGLKEERGELLLCWKASPLVSASAWRPGSAV